MSEAGTELNLGLRLLDDQLFDANDHRCGRVDDVQLEGGAGTRTKVSALLVGSGTWAGRMRRPFSDLAEGVGPGYMHVVPWSEVTRVGTSVELAKTAAELGLGTGDGRSVQWIGAQPRGTIRLSALLRSSLRTSDGQDLGRIWDVRVERQTKLPDERVNEEWLVIGLITGRRGWRERIGMTPEGERIEGETFAPWDAVQDLRDGVVTVSRPS